MSMEGMGRAKNSNETNEASNVENLKQSIEQLDKILDFYKTSLSLAQWRNDSKQISYWTKAISETEQMREEEQAMLDKLQTQ